MKGKVKTRGEPVSIHGSGEARLLKVSWGTKRPASGNWKQQRKKKNKYKENVKLNACRTKFHHKIDVSLNGRTEAPSRPAGHPPETPGLRAVVEKTMRRSMKASMHSSTRLDSMYTRTNPLRGDYKSRHYLRQPWLRDPIPAFQKVPHEARSNSRRRRGRFPISASVSTGTHISFAIRQKERITKTKVYHDDNMASIALKLQVRITIAVGVSPPPSRSSLVQRTAPIPHQSRGSHLEPHNPPPEIDHARYQDPAAQTPKPSGPACCLVTQGWCMYLPLRGVVYTRFRDPRINSLPARIVSTPCQCLCPCPCPHSCFVFRVREKERKKEEEEEVANAPGTPNVPPA